MPTTATGYARPRLSAPSRRRGLLHGDGTVLQGGEPVLRRRELLRGFPRAPASPAPRPRVSLRPRAPEARGFSATRSGTDGSACGNAVRWPGDARSCRADLRLPSRPHSSGGAARGRRGQRRHNPSRVETHHKQPAELHGRCAPERIRTADTRFRSTYEPPGRTAELRQHSPPVPPMRGLRGLCSPPVAHAPPRCRLPAATGVERP